MRTMRISNFMLITLPVRVCYLRNFGASCSAGNCLGTTKEYHNINYQGARRSNKTVFPRQILFDVYRGKMCQGLRGRLSMQVQQGR
jgi:hypothetical protein